MKAHGLALGLVLLLAGCATNTSGVALYGAAGGAAPAAGPAALDGASGASGRGWAGGGVGTRGSM